MITAKLRPDNVLEFYAEKGEFLGVAIFNRNGLNKNELLKDYHSPELRLISRGKERICFVGTMLDNLIKNPNLIEKFL